MIETIVTFFFQTPTLWLPVFILPLLLSAWARRIYPSQLLMAVVAIPAALTILISISFAEDGLPAALSTVLSYLPNIWWLVVGLDLLIGCLAFIDWLLLPSRKQFRAERKTVNVVSIAKDQTASLTLTNLGRWSFLVEIKDDIPDEFVATPESFSFRSKGKSRSTFDYSFHSTKRGKFYLKRVYLRVLSRLRWWNCFYKLPAEGEIKVFPDLKQISEYEILARTNRLSLFGVRRTRKIGQDHDFERLRDYNQDDNYKNIDWRTTARRQKLTVKDFQSSQSQRLIFMVDCGRMMTNRAGEISLLDHSLNAMLMLSYVALRRGDAVGLICFGDKVHSYTPPRSGMNQMNHLLHASFDRHPQLVESRFDEAFLYLRTHCLKRSLVVVITNVIDEINANQIHLYLSALVGRHLPLGVLIRDHQMFDPLEHANKNVASLFEASAAADIVQWRHQVLTDLQHRGVLSLDVFPEDLTAGLVNRYLQIKARHLL